MTEQNNARRTRRGNAQRAQSRDESREQRRQLKLLAERLYMGEQQVNAAIKARCRVFAIHKSTGGADVASLFFFAVGENGGRVQQQIKISRRMALRLHAIGVPTRKISASRIAENALTMSGCTCGTAAGTTEMGKVRVPAGVCQTGTARQKRRCRRAQRRIVRRAGKGGRGNAATGGGGGGGASNALARVSEHSATISDAANQVSDFADQAGDLVSGVGGGGGGGGEADYAMTNTGGLPPWAIPVGLGVGIIGIGAYFLMKKPTKRGAVNA